MFYALHFTFHSTCAVPNMVGFFFKSNSSLISGFAGMLLRYCLSDFEMVPVTRIFTGIIFFHIPPALNFCYVFIF